MCQYQWLPGCWVSVFWDILFLPSVSELIWPFPLPYKHLLPNVACVRAAGDLRGAYLAKSDIASVNHFSKDTYRMQNGRNIQGLSYISIVSCQKGPTRHAYAWQIGPFWQDTLDICLFAATVSSSWCIGPCLIIRCCQKGAILCQG